MTTLTRRTMRLCAACWGASHRRLPIDERAELHRAAVAQAAELARHIWVGFNLCRFHMLEQLCEQEPADLDTERALGQRLAQRLRNLDELMAAANSEESAKGDATVQTPTSASGSG